MALGLEEEGGEGGVDAAAHGHCDLERASSRSNRNSNRSSSRNNSRSSIVSNVVGINAIDGVGVVSYVAVAGAAAEVSAAAIPIR